MRLSRAASVPASPWAVAAWLLRFGLAFGVLNALLTFENRWPGFGVQLAPRLSFELCLGLVLLMGWVAWRGALSARAATLLAAGFVLLGALRYADVTAPAVLGRPVNLVWDLRHAVELLRMATQAWPSWQGAAALAAVIAGAWLLLGLARAAIRELAACLAWPSPRPLLLAAVAALSASFAAYVPGGRDTRWFFALPLAPTLTHQVALLARVLLPQGGDAALGTGPAFDGNLAGLATPAGQADVLLIFAESYGASSFDQPDKAAALAAARAGLVQAIAGSGRGVVSARVRSPTYGGSSWLAHATLLAGLDIADPLQHDLLLASGRPTLVRHFARHGYRTVGWMPGLKRAWPEGAFYGFERLADDAGIGYSGPDFGYWRIPDQAAMAMLHVQELDRTNAPADRAPRFVVFPSVSTHAPFHPLAPLVPDWQPLAGPDAYSREQAAAALAAALDPQRPMPNYLQALRYQFDWLAGYLQQLAPRPLLLIIVGDHQPPALVSGPGVGTGADWDVPVHVIGDDPALLQRLVAQGFMPGLLPSPQSLGPMQRLTQVLLGAFDAPRPPSSVALHP